jgi:predicted aspartyl protease
VSFPFNGQRGLVIVQAEIFGPGGSIVLRLALDTGATATMVKVALLVAVGYDPSLVSHRVQVTTGSGVEFVPGIDIAKIKVLGQERLQFPVLSHTLPPSASIDGLRGLDFLRDQTLVIDFRRGNITLS